MAYVVLGFSLFGARLSVPAWCLLVCLAVPLAIRAWLLACEMDTFSLLHALIMQGSARIPDIPIAVTPSDAQPSLMHFVPDFVQTYGVAGLSVQRLRGENSPSGDFELEDAYDSGISSQPDPQHGVQSCGVRQAWMSSHIQDSHAGSLNSREGETYTESRFTDQAEGRNTPEPNSLRGRFGETRTMKIVRADTTDASPTDEGIGVQVPQDIDVSWPRGVQVHSFEVSTRKTSWTDLQGAITHLRKSDVIVCQALHSIAWDCNTFSMDVIQRGFPGEVSQTYHACIQQIEATLQRWAFGLRLVEDLGLVVALALGGTCTAMESPGASGMCMLGHQSVVYDSMDGRLFVWERLRIVGAPLLLACAGLLWSVVLSLQCVCNSLRIMQFLFE